MNHSTNIREGTRRKIICPKKSLNFEFCTPTISKLNTVIKELKIIAGRGRHVGIWLWALAHSPIQILKFSWPIHT
jgi:hypothetical protein